ncbi:MAG: beta-galactosidase trimerization domain-containing protein, partial [Victivallales bacterium]|nr:beta-galactosidase trimerization domain-containing protein [Victivallales bacterium]
VSGFFIDCLQSHPCVCPVCVQEMKKLGIDWRDEKQVVKFAESSCLRISEDIAKAAREINPDFMLYFNNPSFEDLKDFSSHFECECLPTAGWGYDTLPTMAHYMRTIGKEYPILNMTGRFNNWGDFGGLRTEAGLEYDLLYGLANCMRPNVGGHFHPRGDTIHPVFDRIEKIYKKLQLREPWYDGAENLTDIAVVFPKDIVAIRSDNSLVGAVRILSELKCQFDIVTECSNWEKYSLLVIPDNVTFNDEVAERVKAHISKGGAVIASGESGLNKEESAFALENEWGVKHIGKSDLNPAYFELPKSLSHGLPDMPLSVYAGGEEVEPLPDTVVESKLIKPYYNTHWDGVDAFVYNPPEKTVKAPFLTTKGKVAYFSFRIFEGYFNQAPFHLREMFGNVLNHLLPHPILKTEGLPSFARVFVTKQPDRTMVHLLAYVPEKRGKTQAVDEPITVLDSKISLKCGDTAPQKAYLAPDMNNELPIEQCDGYAAVLLPRFTGYAILVLE